MLRIGVIGYGYWGPNIVRNFGGAEGASVVAICDSNKAVHAKIAKNHPAIRITADSDELVNDPSIDAVAIVTPVSTHYPLTKKALEAGKHVFVEKPFTDTSDHAQELIELAEKKQLTIMVDHTFLFTGAVRKIKQLIDTKELGEIYYYDSTRVNLGLFQHDINVVWDLAPHDLSIMRYLITEKPMAVMACGKAHVNNFENIAFITLLFQSNLIAHFNVNWLSPVKIRSTLIGGEKKMLVWNDVDPDEKIKVYDKGISVSNQENIYNLLVSYRTGDVWSPKLDGNEALKLEAAHFVDCIENKKRPINDGVAGLEIVKILEACDKSLKFNGKQVYL